MPFFSVLVIDDEQAVADLVVKMLREYSGSIRFEAKTANSIAAALAVLKQEKFAAILLDLRLPNGAGVSSFLRIYAAASGTPIIVFTGDDNKEIEERIITAGAQDFLRKPVTSVDHLVTCVHHAIVRCKANAESKKELAPLHDAIQVAQEAVSAAAKSEDKPKDEGRREGHPDPK